MSAVRYRCELASRDEWRIFDHIAGAPIGYIHDAELAVQITDALNRMEGRAVQNGGEK